MIDEKLVYAGRRLIESMERAVDDHLPEEIAAIVKTHAAGAAVAGVASGWVPGAGGVAATAAAIGFIWSMYARINSKLGIPLGNDLVKSIGSAIATNLAAYAVASIAMTTLFSIVPGIGSVGAAAIAGGTTYSLTLVSGLVYLKVLTKVLRAGKDPTQVTVDGMKEAAKDVLKEEDMKSVMKEARSAYTEAKSKGEIKSESPPSSRQSSPESHQSPSHYFATPDGLRNGPFCDEAALAHALRVKFGGQALSIQVWRDGWPSWQPASSVPTLKSLLTDGFSLSPLPPPPSVHSPSSPVTIFHVQLPDGVTEVAGRERLLSLMVEKGLALNDVMVWAPGMPAWVPANTIK